MSVINIIFWIIVFFIFYSFIGYPLSLLILSRIIKKKDNYVDTTLRPFVSIIIPVHNEERVIEQKLNNLINLNYPKQLVEIIIASDNSTDRTNEIVEQFISKNRTHDIKLYKVNKRQGKTNAQNEAVNIAKGEILIFSDANAILDKDSIIHLTSSFTSEDIVYVTGRLKYVKNLESITNDAESKYWDFDLFMRKIESDIKTITAGNGALYAIRKSEYVVFDPIECHDSAMPLEAALNNKRALYNEKAIAYEKTGQTSEDEFKRKVRMFRAGIKPLYTKPQKYNIFKYGWFSYFYFWHRTCRRSLFIFHIVCFITNVLLIKEGSVYVILLIIQCLFYLLALLKVVFGFNKRIFYYPFYYCMTLVAQFVGTVNQLTGKSKPFWEKAESTR